MHFHERNSKAVPCASPPRAIGAAFPSPSSPPSSLSCSPCVAAAPIPFPFDYHISNQMLGKGTYSQVRLAVNKATGTYVAAKCVNLETHENEFDNEVKALSATSHPNLIKMLHYTKKYRRTVGVLYLDYLPYPSLYQYLSKRGSLSELEALNILRQLVDGVMHLHDRSLSHMDLKPENVCIDDNGERAIIFDLGLSLQVDPNHPLTQGFIGSPLYMAPELLKHQLYDPRLNDVWSLGVILFEMLTGNPPFYQCETLQDLLHQVETESLVIPEVSFATRKLISKLLSFNPQSRPDIHKVKKKVNKCYSFVRR